MTKTQESILKQCISRTLILFTFLGITPKVHAYSSITPLQNEAGPTNGLIFKPEMGLGSGVDSSTDLLFGLNAALSSALSVYGRYSLQNDQRLGTSIDLYQRSGSALKMQLEATLSQSSAFGTSAGLFGTLPITLKGLPDFHLEAGAALHYEISNEASSIPFSLLALHTPESKGFHYGFGLTGEYSGADNASWNAFQANLGFQTASQIQYDLIASAPISESSTQGLTLKFGFQIPFGGASESEHKSNPHLPEENPRYNLNAEVVSMNESLFLLKINKGSSDSIANGQTFDIYSEDTLLARAQVISVKKDEAALNVIEYKQEHWIELGFSARRLIE